MGLQLLNLLTLLVLFSICGVNSQAAHFPAGIDPRLCPNYPQCDNAILAAFSKNPLPFMNDARSRGGVGAGGGGNDLKIDHFLFTPPGYPVGLTRDQCPNYPFCH